MKAGSFFRTWVFETTAAMEQSRRLTPRGTEGYSPTKVGAVLTDAKKARHFPFRYTQNL